MKNKSDEITNWKWFRVFMRRHGQLSFKNPQPQLWLVYDNSFVSGGSKTSCFSIINHAMKINSLTRNPDPLDEAKK